MKILGSGTSSTLSAKEIQAKGDADERRYKVIGICIVTVLLTIGGISVIFTNPAEAKNVWLFLGPVISCGLTYLGSSGGRKNT